MTMKSKCAWCDEHFESSSEDPISQKEALKEHIATVHPQIAKTSSPSYESIDEDDDHDDAEDLVDDDHGHDDDDVDDIDDAATPSDSETENEHLGDGEDDGIAEIAEDGVAESAETPEIDDDISRIEPEGEGDGHEAESDLALSNQLHEFSREQDSISLDKRLHNLWNIHDIRNFTDDFEDISTGLEKTWTKVFHEPKRDKKKDASELSERPAPYKKMSASKGDFLEITSLEDFLSQLRDPEARSTDELYAITENVAYALKAWQDEYLAIDRLQKLATRHHKPTAEPRKLEKAIVFEDKKEATLYGFKHDPKPDKVGNQNPFTQGGFKPTGAQARRMAIKAGSDPNPDGWPLITKFGTRYVAKYQNPPREEFVGKATRKRRAAELEANKANETDEAAAESPSHAENEQESQTKRRTRSRRSDIAAEAQATAVPIRSSARGRGRGRGRGGARVGSRATSETPQPGPAVSARFSGRSQGREHTTSLTGTIQTRPATQLAPIEPAPSGGTAPATTGSSTSGTAHGDAMDPSEIARREKIANSKNPKRTEAMLNHWARFNKEGRTRNPKRSKAQIEADKAAEVARKAVEPPKMVGKKRKTVSPVFKGPPRLDTGLAPAHPMPPPASLAPAPPGPHHHLAPMPHPHAHSHPHAHPHPTRGSIPMNPYGAMDPRAVVPFPPPPTGPPGPLQQPPPPYHTPYPFMPYGAGLPPPGHTRPA
ncbi:hypothetical protein FE257_009634 [Aspergillus nanangensis]|uniref:Uncharacterized protein n=1 Tax=Aspergillus nanangensis TaxID=2582783 RepID=A0AAD4CKD5_ASPNN|nr:hypothetical protein FE257_009634 [Aspergillus nanangensis]